MNHNVGEVAASVLSRECAYKQLIVLLSPDSLSFVVIQKTGQVSL